MTDAQAGQIKGVCGGKNGMEPATKYGGPIDPFSPHSLYDVINGDIPSPMGADHSSVEYEGFHIQHQGRGRYHVQYDGHAGTVMSFEAEDYDDVLELVADLNGLLIRAGEYDYRDGKEELVEWAGKIMTSNKERADERPDLYIHIPDDLPPIDGE